MHAGVEGRTLDTALVIRRMFVLRRLGRMKELSGVAEEALYRNWHYMFSTYYSSYYHFRPCIHNNVGFSLRVAGKFERKNDLLYMNRDILCHLHIADAVAIQWAVDRMLLLLVLCSLKSYWSVLH